MPMRDLAVGGLINRSATSDALSYRASIGDILRFLNIEGATSGWYQILGRRIKAV